METPKGLLGIRRGGAAAVGTPGWTPQVAGRAIALTADEAAIGLDRDLQDSGVVGAGKGREGLAAPLTVALLVGQTADLLGGGQRGISTTAMTWGAALLAAWASRWFGIPRRGGCGGKRRRGVGSGCRRAVSVWISGGQAIGNMRGFGTSAEEPVAEVADFSLELGDVEL